MGMREVIVENGRLRGIPSEIPSVTVFKGVPYAAPPVGDLRWKEPEPCKKWEGVYDASSYKPMAAQPDDKNALDQREFCGFGMGELSSEDCLYLNIWTPAKAPDERLPVLVYLHGGGFYQGYSYDITVSGDSFALQGCILATVEYRVGMLGFLSHSELSKESLRQTSGNYGLLDQRAAIAWVHRNIAAFGGDPNTITLFGQSAGAMSAMYQLCSPLTKGTIARAVISSAGGYTGKRVQLMPTLSLAEAEAIGGRMFTELGVATLEEARKIPTQKILDVQHRNGMIFAPIVDGYFLPKHPDEIQAANEHQNVPIIIGYCADENAWFRHSRNQRQELPDKAAAEFEKQIRANYGTYAEQYLESCGYFTNPADGADFKFLDAIAAAALGYCELSTKLPDRKPAYMYFFNRQIPGDDFGAFHAGDLWYAFNTLHRSWRPFAGVDFELARMISSYLCNFARTGDPNGPGLPRWECYTATNRSAMALGRETTMIKYPGTASAKVLVDMIMNR
jgi:para-nitrobenzyl esterase